MAFRGDISTRVPLNSSPAISSRQSPASSPLIRPSLAPVSSQPLSFSISRILDLEDCSVQPQSDTLLPVGGNSNVKSEENINEKSRQSADHSPNVDSDYPSTDVDSDRESDEAGRSAPSSTERPRKKKQRTTFSPIEVWELEKVFAQRPYLMPEDEDDLVQKLGLTARNVRFWFQNRRAKLRRQERAPVSIPQTCFPNQFDWSPLPPGPYGELQFGTPFYTQHVGLQRPPQSQKHAGYSPRNLPAYSPDQAPCPCCPNQSNRFPAVHADLPPHQEDYTPFRMRQFAESSAFMEKLPRPHTNQIYSMPGDSQKSRDYLPHGAMGIREYYNGE
ncbi:Transcription factor lbx1 [Desmophyllum pertusum]|uniref:Transcription factor lbx1 n=1 Tax=Desmophyllum pertusum TaxID=174260 RepID=A0A9W9YM05_9CNID|nr:Transcription factor lbx1 [Desmophyllum pertusum]